VSLPAETSPTPDALAGLARRVERLAALVVSDRHAAADVSQAVLLRAATLSSGAWERPGVLFRMVVNVSRDRHRGERIRRRHETGARPLGVAEDPGELTARRESRERVAAAVRRLPDDERDVVVLKQFEGLTFHQISEALDVPSSTAKSRFARALERLRPWLVETPS
jgi:RNA polymerase sigma-70 factor (ECF subfamily)